MRSRLRDHADAAAGAKNKIAVQRARKAVLEWSQQL